MRGRQASAVAIEDQARQQTRRLGANGYRPRAPTGSEPVLNSLPKFWLDDRRVLAGGDFLLMRAVAPIKPVLQHQVKRAAREALAAGCQFASNRDPLFASNRDPSGSVGLGLSA